MTSPLFTSVHIGGREASHRIVMAPMTRARSTQPGDVPNVRAPVHGDQGFRLEGTTVSGG